MEKKKRQKIKEGAIVKIELSDNRLAFGRLLPGGHIGIYDLVIKQSDTIPTIDKIIEYPIIIYSMIFDHIIKKGIFEITGFKELSHDDVNKIPPHFNQDMINYNCTIYYINSKEIEATPEDCIGLEPSLIWDASGIIKRIEDHYGGKKNFDVEYNKVILSEDDPRFKKGDKVMWDSEKGIFY